MPRRLLKYCQKVGEKLNLPDTVKRIKESREHWIDINGDVYAIDYRNQSKRKLIKKSQTTVRGYKYCGIYYPGIGIINKRVHRLVAEAFIDNPNHYNIIGHKNNIKSDNRVDNLYWTTISENTQKAFDDRLAKNDKGFEDSQSMPVVMFDTKTNEKLGVYGSIAEASRETNIDSTTIARQAKYKRPVRKWFYFRFLDDESIQERSQLVVGEYDFNTDVLIRTFISSGDAHEQTGVPKRTIINQMRNGKPSRSTRQSYFLQINNRKV